MIKNNKKSKVLVLIILTLLVLSVIGLSANNKRILPADKLPTFIKEGNVVTLLRDNDQYFIKNEFFDKDGYYTQPSTEEQISKEDYELKRKALEFDVLESKFKKPVRGAMHSVYQVRDRNGELLAGSFVDIYVEGNDTEISFTEKGRKTILIEKGDRYFVKHISVDDKGEIISNIVTKEVNLKEFNDIKGTNNFNLLEEHSRYSWKSDQYSNVKFYNSDLELIPKQILTKWTSYNDLELYLKDLEDGKVNLPEINVPEPGEEKPEEPEEPGDGEEGEYPEDNDDWWDTEDDDWSGGIWDEDVVDIDDINNKPNKPNKPSKPVVPNRPEKPEKPSKPSNPSKPSKPNIPNKPETPNIGNNAEDKDDEDIWNENNQNNNENDEVLEEKPGYTDDKGNFIETDVNGKVKTSVEGSFDLDGNFFPTGSSYYFDPEGIRHPIEELGYVKGFDKKGNFHTNGEGFFDVSGLWHSLDEISKGGYYDKDGNFFLEDGSGYIDEDGFFHESIQQDKLTTMNVELKEKTKLTTDKQNRLKVIGMKGYFNNDGLYNAPNGRKGYFNSRGEFREDRVNQYAVKKGFYDKFGNWYSFTDFYKDNLGVNKVVLSPDLNIKVKDEKIKIGSLKGSFDTTGLYTIDDKIGYFDEHGSFVEGTYNPYEGGFYSNSEWIHDNFITNTNTSLEVKFGEFDNYGNYTTAYGDVGHFNEEGIFEPFTLNPNNEGFYDNTGKFHAFGKSYKDKYGNIFTLGNPSFFTKAGVKINGEYVLGQAINDIKLRYDGSVVKNNEIGYFNENKEFIKGNKPFDKGYYTNTGDFIEVNEDNHVRGEANIYGEFIILNDKVILPNGIQIAANRDNKMNITFGGLVVDSKGQLGFYDSSGEIKTTKDIKDFVVEHNNEVGFYDSNGNFVKSMDENNGFYDDENNYHLFLEDGYFDKKGNFIGEDEKVKYFDESGKEIEGTNPYINGFFIKNGKFIGEGEPMLRFFNAEGELVEGNELLNDDGFYDKFKNFHPFKAEEGFVEAEAEEIEKGSILLEDGTIFHKDGKIQLPNGSTGKVTTVEIGKDQTAKGLDKTLFLNEDRTSYGRLKDDGSIEVLGKTKTLGVDAVKLEDGRIVLLDGQVINTDGSIDKIKLDENKDINLKDGTTVKRSGVVGIKTSFKGFYDQNGTIYRNGPNSIGLINEQGHFIPHGYEGYFDDYGNYVNEDTVGHYNKDGQFFENKNNPHMDGFYDANKNWHPFDEEGYYKPNGEYIENIFDQTLGYYNKDGVLLEGTNPYVKGFYNEKGHWKKFNLEGVFDTQGSYIIDGKTLHFNENGELVEGENTLIDGFYDDEKILNKFIEGQDTIYFNKDGEELIGVSPYIDGYYDNLGNWHSFSEKGYYTKKGSFVGEDKEFKYYDKLGYIRKGTNPYLYGYYDVDNNWHPFDSKGFYSSDGTFNGENGVIGYFNSDGEFTENKRNPNNEGFYDEFGNYIPFNEDGFYNKAGEFKLDKFYDSRFEYGSPDYIYNPGYFTNGFPNMLTPGGLSLQYTTNKNVLNPRYIETGIAIPQNAIISYEDMSDALHGIAIQTGNRFIKDRDYSMLVYEGRVINLERDKGITLSEIKEMFMNTKIDLAIKQTRFAGEYMIVDAIESNQDIGLYRQGIKHDFKLPLLARNNTAYISAKDLAQIIGYKVEVNNHGNNTRIVLRNDKVSINEYENITLIADTKGVVFNGEKIMKLGSPTLVEKIDGLEEVYVPVDLLVKLIGQDLTWDSVNFNFVIDDKEK